MKEKKRKNIVFGVSVTIIVIIVIGFLVNDNVNKKKSAVLEVDNDNSFITADASESVKRSLLNFGNTYRINKAMGKMRQGEDIKLAFLGGSITEGYLVKSNQNYVTKTTKWLKTKFKNDNIRSVNAGLSGTSSTIGLLRAEQDIFSEAPDIIVIEFAVNDAKDTTSSMIYESLIKRCLKQENAPAVILLFTVLENGYTCEDEMKRVGEAYQLPMISVKKAITEELDNKTMIWSDYALDEAHPNKDGHSMISDYLTYYFECVERNTVDNDEIDYDTIRVYATVYSSMKFYNNLNLYPDSLGGFLEGDSNLVHFPNGWVWGKDKGNFMEFRMTGKNLFLLFKEDNSVNMGSIKVLIDGIEKQVVNGNSSSGWNNPQVVILLNEVEEKEHVITIEMQADMLDKNFHILGFGTTGEIFSAKRLTQDMIPLNDRAILNVGNTERLRTLMQKAEQGEELAIGFIGGSITMGSGASSKETCYAKLVYDWWCNEYPNAKFNYVNAGIGATTSQFACARVEDDLLRYNPDFVVVEFSVNDESNLFYKDSYESLLRMILSKENAPAVLVLNMVGYNNGNNVQNMHNEIAIKYSLPIVSMKESVFEEILLGKLKASDVSADNLHPNDLGHSYGATIVTNYLQYVESGKYESENNTAETDKYLLPTKMSECKSMTLTRYNNSNSSPILDGFEIDKNEQDGITDIFKNGFLAKNKGDSIIFEVTGGSISLQYKRTNTLGAPKALAIIDGNEANPIELNGNFENGWGDWLYWHNILVDGENTKHTVEIRILEGAEKYFNLVSLIVGE